MFGHEKNHNYRTIALYVLGVIVISMSFFWLLTNFSAISAFFSGVLNVFSPFIYGFIIAYLANPVMKLIERKIFRFKPGSKADRKLRRPLSATLTMIFLLTVVTIFVWLIVPQVMKSFMELESQIESYVAAAQNGVDKFVREFPLFNGQYETFSEFLDVNELSADLKAVISTFYNYLEIAVDYVIRYAGRFVVEVKNVLIGLIAAIYLLLSKERLVAKLKKFLASFMKRRHYLNLIYLMRYTDKTVGGFLIGKIIDSIIIGFLTLFVMNLAKMPFASLISVIVGATNIIPFFGPFIGAIPSAFIIFIADPPMTIWFILMILVIQQLDGNVIGPKILGSSTGLTSLAVLVAITIAGGFFGFAGMIFGVPAAAVICALSRQWMDKRLRTRNMPTDLDFYVDDPPPRDYSTQTIVLDPSEPTGEENAAPSDVSESVAGEET